MCAVPCAVSCVDYDVVPCECYDVLCAVAVADTRSVATRGACIARV